MTPKADPKELTPAPKELTPAEAEARRAALIAELDALPTPKVEGLKPGSKIGDGVTSEYVPYTTQWFLDVEARRKDVGPDGKLVTPDYQLHEFIPNETLDVTIQGVSFRVLAGRRCKLPTPHYNVYVDRLNRLQEAADMFNPPEGGPKPMQVYRIDGPWKKQDLSQ